MSAKLDFAGRTPSVDEAAEWVHASWRQGIAAIIETGRRLIVIRQAYKDYSGRWSELIGVGEKPGALPFGKSNVYRLIAIAENADRLLAHSERMPIDSWLLYDIARLDEETFQARLADGTIHPELRRRNLSMLRDPSSVSTTDPVSRLAFGELRERGIEAMAEALLLFALLEEGQPASQADNVGDYYSADEIARLRKSALAQAKERART